MGVVRRVEVGRQAQHPTDAACALKTAAEITPGSKQVGVPRNVAESNNAGHGREKVDEKALSHFKGTLTARISFDDFKIALMSFVSRRKPSRLAVSTEKLPLVAFSK